MIDSFIAAAMFTTDPDLGSGEYAAHTDGVQPDFRVMAVKMVLDFETAFEADIEELCQEDLEHIGRDIWYTSAGHGIGFWDGDWDHLPNNFAKRATEWCEANGKHCEFNYMWKDIYNG